MSSSRDVSSVFSTNARAPGVLTNKAPHACIACSIMGGLSSKRSVGMWRTGIWGRNAFKKIKTAGYVG